MENKTITWSNRASTLRDYGVKRVTGEACGVGLRILYDLTPEAAKTMEEMLGGVKIQAPGWSGEEFSIMLSGMWTDEVLLYFLLTEYEVVVVKSYKGDGSHSDNYLGRVIQDSILCYNTLDDWNADKEILNRKIWNYQVYWRTGTAPGGMRNRHEWSGRIE